MYPQGVLFQSRWSDRGPLFFHQILRMGNFQTSNKSHFWSFLEIQRRVDVHRGGYVFYQNIEMHYGVLGFRENMADDVQVFDGSWSRTTVYYLKTAKSYPLAIRESRGKNFCFLAAQIFLQTGHCLYLKLIYSGSSNIKSIACIICWNNVKNTRRHRFVWWTFGGICLQ